MVHCLCRTTILLLAVVVVFVVGCGTGSASDSGEHCPCIVLAIQVKVYEGSHAQACLGSLGARQATRFSARRCREWIDASAPQQQYLTWWQFFFLLIFVRVPLGAACFLCESTLICGVFCASPFFLDFFFFSLSCRRCAKNVVYTTYAGTHSCYGSILGVASP